jgi:osmotically-inducible protein OsmY
MNKTFIMLAIGATSLLSADYYQDQRTGSNLGSQINPQNPSQSYNQQYNQGYNSNAQDARNNWDSNRSQNNEGWFRGQDNTRSIQQENGGVGQRSGTTPLGSYDKNISYGDNSVNSSTWSNQTSSFPQDSATTDADKALNTKIRDKLNNNWFSKNFDSIVLRTNNGVVTVTGNVEKANDVQKVTDEIKKISGVRNVDNQLNVRNQY